MPQFLDRVERRQIDDDRAKAKDSVIGSHIMRDIWQEQPDPVAAPDPKAFQTASNAISRRGDFGIAIATAVEIDQRRLRGPRGRRGHHVRQAQGFESAATDGDRKRGVSGKRVYVRVDLECGRLIYNKKKKRRP